MAWDFRKSRKRTAQFDYRTAGNLLNSRTGDRARLPDRRPLSRGILATIHWLYHWRLWLPFMLVCYQPDQRPYEALEINDNGLNVMKDRQVVYCLAGFLIGVVCLFGGIFISDLWHVSLGHLITLYGIFLMVYVSVRA